MTAPGAGLVATVAGAPITLAAVKEHLAKLRRGRLGRQIPPEGGEAERLLRWGVQELVTRAVLLHEAASAGLLPDAGPARGTVTSGAANSGPSGEAGSGPALAPDTMRRLVDRATADVSVPESDVRAYYQRNIDLFERPETRRVDYAIAMTRPRARSVLEGDPLDPRAVDATDVRQGVLQSLRRGELAGPLEDAVFAADVGEVVGAFERPGGWIAARVDAIMPAATASFDEVRGAIEAELLGAARARAFDEWVASRRSAIAVIEHGYEHPGHPIHGLPHHRH